jgi:hypothetical protein
VRGQRDPYKWPSQRQLGNIILPAEGGSEEVLMRMIGLTPVYHKERHRSMLDDPSLAFSIQIDKCRTEDVEPFKAMPAEGQLHVGVLYLEGVKDNSLGSSFFLPLSESDFIEGKMIATWDTPVRPGDPYARPKTLKMHVNQCPDRTLVVSKCDGLPKLVKRTFVPFTGNASSKLFKIIRNLRGGVDAPALNQIPQDAKPIQLTSTPSDFFVALHTVVVLPLSPAELEIPKVPCIGYIKACPTGALVSPWAPGGGKCRKCRKKKTNAIWKKNNPGGKKGLGVKHQLMKKKGKEMGK